MSVRLGIDLGGTAAKIGVLQGGMRLKKVISVPTEGFPRPVDLASRLREAVAEHFGKVRVSSIGVGVAGDIDSARGVVRVSPNLKWEKVPLGALLKKVFRCSVHVENDAKAAAWGVYKTQTSPTIRNMVVMTLGTGVGGDSILNGQLYRGSTGSAGEVGHTNIEKDGPLCNCGLRGCLETYVGGPHLVRWVVTEMKNGRRSSLQPMANNNPDSVTPKLIAEHAAAGDALSLEVWARAGWALGVAIGDLVYLLNPELIVFTGGIARAFPHLSPSLRATLTERPFKTPIHKVRFRVATKAPHIGVLGASLL